MRDFPAGKGLDVHAAWVLLGARYQAVGAAFPTFIDFLRTDASPFPAVFKQIASVLHEILFQDILANAGKFRIPTEPMGGYVGFGKGDLRKPSGNAFSGTTAVLIDREMTKVMGLLSRDDPDPEMTSIVFYQQFVRVHPYYDANGRIARALVSIYLQYYRKRVLWKDLETKKKRQFLKKLNQCHKLTDPGDVSKDTHVLNTYRRHLVGFWKKFIVDEVVLGPDPRGGATSQLD